MKRMPMMRKKLVMHHRSTFQSGFERQRRNSAEHS
jgi:hypothetical protein